jgi:lipooligosaccharide transport system permease protein
VVECLPLFHAVELMRAFTTGIVGPGVLGHAAYFVIMATGGALIAARRLNTLLLR